jgi:hypothetical protein
MKNLLLTFVGFLFTANLFAQTAPQKADTVFTYEWKSEEWEFTWRSFNTYNEECQSESLTSQALVNGLWINSSKTLYTYNANSRVSAQTEQLWDTISSSFEKSYRYAFTYNASGNTTFMLFERWDGSAWQNDSRYTYTYDGNGYLISLLEEAWFGGSWVNNLLYTYTNNSGGTPHIVLGQAWNRGTATWENSWRTTYTYNGAGKIFTILLEQWQSASWVNIQRWTYTYSGNDLTNEIREHNSNAGWVNEHQSTYTYNGDGTVSQTIFQHWDEGEGIWVNSGRLDHVYTTACALPLTLLNFTGTKNNSSVLLTWKTANEINTSHFAVQRSLDAVDFTDIKIVPATSGSVTKTYSFTDNVAAIKAPKIYYRLKMVDKDGKFSYSAVVQVDYTKINIDKITITPNPLSNSTTISFSLSNTQKVSINIFDMNGRLVKTLLNSELQQGTHQLVWNVKDEKGNAVTAGIYFLRMQIGNSVETKKIIVAR